jgi:hypothetical protein
MSKAILYDDKSDTHTKDKSQNTLTIFENNTSNNIDDNDYIMIDPQSFMRCMLRNAEDQIDHNKNADQLMMQLINQNFQLRDEITQLKNDLLAANKSNMNTWKTDLRSSVIKVSVPMLTLCMINAPIAYTYGVKMGVFSAITSGFSFKWLW